MGRTSFIPFSLFFLILFGSYLFGLIIYFNISMWVKLAFLILILSVVQAD